jgi:hypothetical protein
MIFRNLIFEPEVVKQRLRAGMVSHHEQQASKCNGEKQHRVLWPAYNLNIAPPQASTEGLFQQTQPVYNISNEVGRVKVLGVVFS